MQLILIMSLLSLFHCAICRSIGTSVEDLLNTQNLQFCHPHLSDIIQLACQGRTNSPDDTGGSGGGGGLAAECCDKVCSPNQMISYCEDPESSKRWWIGYLKSKMRNNTIVQEVKSNSIVQESHNKNRSQHTTNRQVRPKGTNRGSRNDKRRDQNHVVMQCTYPSYGQVLLDVTHLRRIRRGKIQDRKPNGLVVKSHPLNNDISRPIHNNNHI